MKSRRLEMAIPVAAVGLLALLPMTGLQEYWIYTLTIGFYYALMAASWALLVGYVGRISFAHAAMAGLGAYASGLSALHLQLPLPLSLLAAVLVATLAGVAIGWLTLKLHGAYLGLTTIAFSELLRITITAEHQFTAGSLGLKTPPLVQGGDAATYYYIFLCITVACVLSMLMLLRSRIGLFFQSIREDEDGAASLGVNVTLWKVSAFAISSAFAGFAGALYGHFVQLITPSMMSIQEMGYVLAMAVIGGFHNVVYAAFGGILLQLLLEGLREAGEWRLAIFGLVALLVLRLAPNGLFGSVAAVLRRKGQV